MKNSVLSRHVDEDGNKVEYSPDDIADWAITEMTEIICDISLASSQQINRTMDTLEELGYSRKQLFSQQFVDLFSDLNNHTRMPVNRGFTPDEVFSRSGSSFPRAITFGPGMQEMIRSGDIDREAYKRSIMGDPNLSMDLKTSLMREVEHTLKPGEEKWVGGTLVKGEKSVPMILVHAAAERNIKSAAAGITDKEARQG